MFVTRNVWIKYHNAADGEGNDLGGGAGEGGSATSFVDVPAVVEETADFSTEESVNWRGISDEFQAEDEAIEGEEVVVEKPVEETPPPAEATPPAATPTPAEPATPTPAPSAPAVASPATPVATPEEYSTWRANRLTQLEQMYAIDPEAATALLTEPETVLPKLAAKVHMEVMENSMRAMQAMVPVMMQQVQQHSELNNRAKSLFHTTNPDLVDPQLEPMIMELGQAYRRVNQTAPAEVAAKAIGNLVRAALGIAAPQAQAQVQQPVQQTRAPVTTPFSPARGAGGGNAPVVPANPFEALAMEFLNEDN